MIAPPLVVRGGIPGFARRVQAGEALKIVAFGTSMTLYGHYLAALSATIEAATGNHAIRLVNKGLRGMFTFAAAFRVHDDVVPEQPDLVLIEFAHNDGLPDAVAEIPAALDGIVAQIRAANPGCEFVFVYLAPRDAAAAGATPAMHAYEATAEYYGFASIDLATFTESLIAAGAASWSGEGAPALVHDGVHHTPFAQQLLGVPFADAFVHLIDAPAPPRSEREVRSTRFAGAYGVPAAGYLAAGQWALGVPNNHDSRNAEAYRAEVAQATAPGAMLRLHFRGTYAGAWALGGGALSIVVDGHGPVYTASVTSGSQWQIVTLTPELPDADHVVEVTAVSLPVVFGDVCFIASGPVPRAEIAPGPQNR